MYHRIADALPDRHRLCVTPDDFRGHMEHLRGHDYCVLSLAQLAQAFSAHDVPDRAVAITFDDGYLDALTVAAPILRGFAFPATFFVVPSAMRTGDEFWWTRLERLLLSDHTLPASIQLAEDHATLPTSTLREREIAFDHLSDVLYAATASARAALLSAVVDWSGLEWRASREIRSMTIEEVRELAAMPGMSVGAHSVSHLLLPAQPEELRRAEIADSKTQLEEMLDCQVTSFAYPYGECDAATARAVADAGFLVAVTTNERPVASGLDPFQLPRYNVTTSAHLIGSLDDAFASGLGAGA